MLPQNLVEIEAREEEVEFSIASKGGNIELIVRLEGASVVEARTTACEIAGKIEEMLVRARIELVSAFLNIVNGGYLNKDAPPISPGTFLERAVLSGIESDTDGNITFCFDDDGMLWGHQMILNTDLGGTDWSSTTWG